MINVGQKIVLVLHIWFMYSGPLRQCLDRSLQADGLYDHIQSPPTPSVCRTTPTKDAYQPPPAVCRTSHTTVHVYNSRTIIRAAETCEGAGYETDPSRGNIGGTSYHNRRLQGRASGGEGRGPIHIVEDVDTRETWHRLGLARSWISPLARRDVTRPYTIC